MDFNQSAKADAGKLPLTLVPLDIVEAIAVVREYGNRKYGDPDNWRTVEKGRYRDALFRHLVAYLRDPKGCDEESDIPHLYHLACNVAFLVALEIADGTLERPRVKNKREEVKWKPLTCLTSERRQRQR